MSGAGRLIGVLLLALLATLAAAIPPQAAMAASGDLLPRGVRYRASTYAGHPSLPGFGAAIDLNQAGGDCNKPVIAPSNGTVAVHSTGWGGGWGNSIIFSAGSERIHVAHLSSIVRTGRVTAGQVIARAGATGHVEGSTDRCNGQYGAHLHVARSVNGSPAALVLSGRTVRAGNWYTSRGAGTSQPPRQGEVLGTTLRRGQTMRINDRLRSSNGQYTLRLQTDGNLVLRDRSGRSIWDTDSYGATRVVHQHDGNVVAYAGSRPLWATNTNGRSTDRFVMQNDRNLVLYGGGRAYWASNTVRPDTRRTITIDEPRRYGEARWWVRRTSTSAGHGSDYWLTLSAGDRYSRDIVHAIWGTSELRGRYEVQCFIPRREAISHARYRITAAEGTVVRVLHQRHLYGWTSLGRYQFSAGGQIRLGDHTGHDDYNQWIGVDACRFIPR